MHRFWSLLTVLLFLIVLSVPPLITLLGPHREVSQLEKRTLAPLPVPGWSVDEMSAFPALFEAYYKDHFGLRDALVHFQNLFALKVFRVSPHPAVTVGRDNWLYYNGDDEILGYLGLLPLSSAQLEMSQLALLDRRDWLAERGIKYLFLPVPNKETVYPEFLPHRILQQAGRSIYDQVISYLKKQHVFTEFIDLKQIFQEYKGTRKLYLKTDTHWNFIGAFVAYQHVLRWIIARKIPARLLEPQQIDWSNVDFCGDLTNFLHLCESVQEVAPQVNGVEPCPAAQGDNAKFQKDFVDFKRFADDHRHFVMEHGCQDIHSSVLVIHDSFGEFLHPFLSASFGKVYYVEQGFEKIKDFIEWARPDVVIDQRVERNLLLALVTDREVECAVLKKRFPLSQNVKLRIDRMSPEQDLRNTSGVEVTPVANGLRIQSQGKGSFLGFTYDPGDDDAPLMVRIRLTSPQWTEFSLAYTTAQYPVFAPSQTISMPLMKGYNELYFRLPSPGTPGKLKFFPGEASGEYILHSFIIKQENPFVL